MDPGVEEGGEGPGAALVAEVLKRRQTLSRSLVGDLSICRIHDIGGCFHPPAMAAYEKENSFI